MYVMNSISPKKKIGVVRGGSGQEYNFSYDSGAHVLMSLEKTHSTKDILIDKEGNWLVGGKYQKPEIALWDVDLVFNALHGTYGEGGQMQDLFEAHSLPYTGSDSFSSASSLYKQTAKKFFKVYGLRLPFSKYYSRIDANITNLVMEIFNTLPLPLIVKPANLGFSIGVRMVSSFQELESAVTHAFSFGDAIIVEEYINGRVLTCGVIEGYREQDLYVLAPVEIKLPTNTIFLEYEKRGLMEYIVPAYIKMEEKIEIQEMAKLAHRILGLRQYSASDFILSPTRGIFLLETNSLPYLGSHTPFVASLEALGSSRDEFVQHIISNVK